MGRMQNITKHVTKKALAKGHLTEQEVDTLLDDYIHGAKQQYRGDVMAAVIDKFLSRLPDKFKQMYEDGIQELFVMGSNRNRFRSRAFLLLMLAYQNGSVEGMGTGKLFDLEKSSKTS
jgi:hypothetical protein